MTLFLLDWHLPMFWAILTFAVVFVVGFVSLLWKMGDAEFRAHHYGNWWDGKTVAQREAG